MAEAWIIGAGITVRGGISGSGALTVQGRVEGNVALPAHALTVEPGAAVVADVTAARVVVKGTLEGTVVATQSVAIAAGARVIGDIRTPRISIEEGAHFRGNIEMDVALPSGA